MNAVRRRRSRGQALPEFALVLPVLMLVLLIAVDFGRLFFGWVTLNNAARIAANYAAAAQPTEVFTAGSTYEATVRRETNNNNCPVGAVTTWQPTFNPDRSVGSTATVSISCEFKILTPFIGGLVGDPLTLSATSIFIVRSGTVNGIPISSPGTSPAPSSSPAPSASASPAPSTTPAPPSCPGSNLSVPNLVGLTVGEGRTAWTAAGFTGSYSPNQFAGFDSTVVTDQVPAAGTCKNKNTNMVVQHT